LTQRGSVGNSRPSVNLSFASIIMGSSSIAAL
jgi:hypothetical protein